MVDLFWQLDATFLRIKQKAIDVHFVLMRKLLPLLSSLGVSFVPNKNTMKRFVRNERTLELAELLRHIAFEYIANSF